MGATIAPVLVDAAWATDGGQRQSSGMWPFVTATDPGPRGFLRPIAEYVDKDRATELAISGAGANGGFRFWDEVADNWGPYVNVSSAGWVDLEYTAAKTAGHLTETWSLNGNVVVTDQTTGTLADSAVALRTIIVNSKNFGDAQTYYYDDIKIVGVPDSSEAAYAAAHILSA